MAKSCNQKQKLLFILDLLREKSDENHLISVNEMISFLARNDIKAERKSIYDDIDTLKNYKYDIILQKGRNGGYYLANRDFETAEIKLLVDVVQSSKFITDKKSNQLISKLESLTSKYEAKNLQRQVVVSNRIKNMNESIYYNVDKLHYAISRNVKVNFNYFEWTVDKKQNLRRNGKIYSVSPWYLHWCDENYYLIAFDSDENKIKHYRIDKMKNISLADEQREGAELFDGINIADYANKTFCMYGGRDENISLKCKNSIIGVIIGRFGNNIPIHGGDDEYFYVNIDVKVSPQFFGWIAGLGENIIIEGPKSVTEEYKAFIGDILKNYT